MGIEVLEAALSEARQALGAVIQREQEAEATLNLSVDKIEDEDTAETQTIIGIEMTNLIIAPAPKDVISITWVDPLAAYLPAPVEDPKRETISPLTEGPK